MRMETTENNRGGIGPVHSKFILDDNQKNDKTKMFSEVTVPAGSSIGYHVHHDESETYYILSGEGEFNDNGTIRTVKKGDVTFTPSGMGHGMKNNGPDDLVFMALIQLD